VTLLLHQLRFERVLFRRNPSAAFFNFVLPLVLLLLVASVFADDDDELEVLIPGIAGMAIMATTFTALAFNTVFLREQGILKRIRGTPIPPASYLGGLVGSAVVNAVVQVVLVFAIGKLAYDVDLPDEPGAVIVYAVTGVAAFAALDHVVWRDAALVGLPAMAGALAGTSAQRRLSTRWLTLLFAVFLVAVAVRLLAE